MEQTFYDAVRGHEVFARLVHRFYAGVADDFDGLFQRLHVAPGRHEISLKLSGPKTHRVRVYVGSGATLKLDHDLDTIARKALAKEPDQRYGSVAALAEDPDSASTGAAAADFAASAGERVSDMARLRSKSAAL